MSKTLCALAAVAVAAVLTVPTVAQAQESASVEVRFDDLNLTHASGRTALERRVDSAARSLCGNAGGRDLTINRAIAACHVEALNSARPAVETAIANARGGGTATVVAMRIIARPAQ